MIEVEKKFILTPEQEKSLTEGAEFLGEKKFTDIYYDDVLFSLTTKDIWLRERDGKYELKLPMNEALEKRVTDQYRELETESEITAYFQALGKSTKDYIPFCSVTTTRKKYKKDGFGIDLDVTDFRYTIAEIELMISEESEIKEAAEAIIQFAKKHGIDAERVVRGKVAEFLRMKNPAHLQVLIDAKVIK